MTSAPAIDARRVVKLFGSTPALVRVDLLVPAGSVCAILGGNGAGKSTLLRVIATALRPTSGTVRVHGRETTSQAGEVRGLIDLMPSDGGCYPELSAAENLRFALGMRGVPERAAEISGVLERVGLRGVADDRARTFSSGMLRRLAVARLLLTRPRVALLDEPYGPLDDEGRSLVDALLTEVRSQARTALVVTHEHDRARAVADSTCWLHRGQVLDDAAQRPVITPAQAAA